MAHMIRRPKLKAYQRRLHSEPDFSMLSFTPKLWLDASAITGLNDGDSVTTWSDLSGNGKDATGTTNKPTYKKDIFSGKPIVRFDGSNDVMTGSAWSFTSMTLLMVVDAINKSTSDAGILSFYKSSGANDYDNEDALAFVITSTAGTCRLVRTIGTNGLGVNMPMVAAGAQIVCLKLSAGIGAIEINGGPPQFDTYDNLNSIDSTNYVLGARWVGSAISYFGQRDFGEIVAFDRLLSSNEQRMIEHHLALKYGLNLN